MRNLNTHNNIEMSEQRIDNWLYRIGLLKPEVSRKELLKKEM